MAALFLDVALRATLIAAGTACVLWALRVRTAAERHAAWTAVLVCMLLLPIYSLAGPKVPFAVVPGNATSPEFESRRQPRGVDGGAGLSLTPLALFADTAPRYSTGPSRGSLGPHRSVLPRRVCFARAAGYRHRARAPVVPRGSETRRTGYQRTGSSTISSSMVVARADSA